MAFDDLPVPRGSRPAAFATVCLTAIILGTREKPASVPYKQLGAVHLAQLGVDRRFQGAGLGSRVVADVIGLAREVSGQIACRYLALDAQPDLVGWYESQGFRINKTMRNVRVQAKSPADAGSVPVSMRFDLVEPSG